MFWNIVWYYLVKININSPYDPEIVLLPKHIPNLNVYICALKGMLKNIHNSPIYNSLKLKISNVHLQ